MGKVFEQIIDTFDGGLSEDKRSKQANKFSISKHFDTFTYPHKLVPQPQTAAQTDEQKTYDIVRFTYGRHQSVGSGFYRLYGWGKDGSGYGAMYELDISVDNDQSWVLSAGYSTALTRSATDEKVFFTYKNYIYAWCGGQYLCKWDWESNFWTTNYYDATAYTNICQPVHHPSDDIAYFFHDNFVHKLNDTSWSAKVLTFPDDLKITAACPFGNYLAIACATVDTTNQKSVVYLWDRDSSLATLTERIDFGQGEIVHLASLDNKLIAINHLQNFVTRDKVLIQQASGQAGITLNEISTDVASGIVLSADRVIKNNKLYFPMKATLDSDTRLGIWAVDSYGRITLDFVPTPDPFETIASIEGIFNTGNYWWIAHSNDGSVDVSSGNGTCATLGYSLYESLIFNGGDSGQTKKLLSFAVMSEPLPSGGDVNTEYRKDEETAWTSLLNSQTQYAVSKDCNKTLAGVNLPNFKEIQFRLYSQDGAVITGYKFKYEILGKEL